MSMRLNLALAGVQLLTLITLMGVKRKSVPLDSPEALDYLTKMLGVPVYYGEKPAQEIKELQEEKDRTSG